MEKKRILSYVRYNLFIKDDICAEIENLDMVQDFSTRGAVSG